MGWLTDFFSTYQTQPDVEGKSQSLREYMSGLETGGASQTDIVNALFGAMGTGKGLSPWRRQQFQRAAGYGGLTGGATLRELARGVDPEAGENVASVTDFLLGADDLGGALSRGNPFAKKGDVAQLLGAQPGGGGGVGQGAWDYLSGLTPTQLTKTFQAGTPSTSMVQRARRQRQLEQAGALGTGLEGQAGFGEVQRIFGVPRTTAEWDLPPDLAAYTDVDPTFWGQIGISPEDNYIEVIGQANLAQLQEDHPEIARQLQGWSVAQVLAQQERTWTEPSPDPGTRATINSLKDNAQAFRNSYGYWPSFVEASEYPNTNPHLFPVR